jgi:DNA-directed RNA polymerase beta subunit
MSQVKKFFDLANWSMRKIHKDIIFEILSAMSENQKMSVTGPEDEEECIINMKTYGHIVSFEPNENSFCVPCPTPQGYFIIEGKKKVVVHQERKDSSQIVVLKEDDYFKCSIRRICSKTGPLGIGHIETLEIRGKMQGRFIKSVEMRLGSMIMFSETTSSSGQTKQKIWVSAHRFMDECVENWMNKVMQCSSDAMRMKTSLTELDILFDEERAGMAETTATEYVIDEIFFRECFSDCTKESRDWTVCFALAKVIETMIGVRLLDDIDELMFKRIMTPAHMIKHSLFFALSKEAELRSLTDRFRRGTWRTAYGSSVEGVSQSLSSRSELDELSHVRRISVPLDVHAANVSVRQIRKSQMGFICPCETPEGKEVGIVKYLSLTSFVTPDTSEKVVFGLSLLQNHLTKNEECAECAECDVTDKKFLFLNNVIVGCLDENALHPTSPQRHRHTRHTRHTTRVGSRKALPEWLPTVVRNARKERKKNDALKFVSIYEDGEGHVHISSDSGRLCRPLVDEDGDIVYIDVAEQFYSILCAKNNTQVNVSKQVLSEIHPSLVFGVSASMIPFINHNQSPRAVFQSSMNKQALCTMTERLKWTEGEKKTVDYAQKPFCYTMSSSLVSSMN